MIDPKENNLPSAPPRTEDIAQPTVLNKHPTKKHLTTSLRTPRLDSEARKPETNGGPEKVCAPKLRLALDLRLLSIKGKYLGPPGYEGKHLFTKFERITDDHSHSVTDLNTTPFDSAQGDRKILLRPNGTTMQIVTRIIKDCFASPAMTTSMLLKQQPVFTVR